MDVSLGALLDTKGPEIRLGKIEGGKTVLKDGDPFTLTTEQIVGDNTRASVSFQDLTKDVKEGDRILIDDGLIELQVQKVSDKEIQCVVLNGGPISDHKGVNVPNVELSMPYLSDKDRDDIKFGIEAGFDFIAASFTAARRTSCRSGKFWRKTAATPSRSSPRLKMPRASTTSTRFCASRTAP